jgi:hypothetical protein
MQIAVFLVLPEFFRKFTSVYNFFRESYIIMPNFVKTGAMEWKCTKKTPNTVFFTNIRDVYER